MKIFAQIVPLVQLTLKDNFIFWCVKDHSLSDEIVSLNSEFAKRLGIKTGEKVCIFIIKRLLNLFFSSLKFRLDLSNVSI